MIKQSKPNKITTTTKIKWQRLREERCKHKDNTAMCYRRENRNPQRKKLFAALQAVNNPLKNEVGIHEQQKILQA